MKCCWVESQDDTNEDPWCFKAVEVPTMTCSVHDEEREECGHSGTTQDYCEDVLRCCWKEAKQPCE